MKSIDYHNSSNECIMEEGIQTNLSISNCKLPDCIGDKYIFKETIEPSMDDGIIILNETKDSTVIKNNNCENSFYHPDPRLKSSMRGGSVIYLDKSPQTYNYDPTIIDTDISLNNYGANYKSYSDINTGQIIYYINKKNQDAFNYPIFTTSVKTTGYLYKDPMGSIKPYYVREPLYYDDPTQTKNSTLKRELSWIRDSQEHREDIMSKQLYIKNRQKWDTRWV